MNMVHALPWSSSWTLKTKRRCISNLSVLCLRSNDRSQYACLSRRMVQSMAGGTATTLTRLLAAAQADLLDPRECAYHGTQRPAFLNQRGPQPTRGWSCQIPLPAPRCSTPGVMSPFPSLPCDTSPLHQRSVSRRYVPRIRVVPRTAVPRQYRNPVLPHPARVNQRAPPLRWWVGVLPKSSHGPNSQRQAETRPASLYSNRLCR